MDTKLIVYVLAVAFALLWLGTLVWQYKQVQKKSLELATSAASVVFSAAETLVGLALGLLGLILFFGALWFTIGPYFDPRIAKWGSPLHIAGATLDWAAFLFVDALLKNLKEVSASIRLILSGDPPGRFDARGTEGIRANARQFANIQPEDDMSFPAATGAAAGGAPVTPPEVIKRELPDSWAF